MKIEKRGKYAGVKVHLEPEECEILLKVKEGGPTIASGMGFNLMVKLGKKLNSLIKEEPTLLQERTPEEIKAELENEYESARLKLAAIKHGQDWKEVHVQ